MFSLKLAVCGFDCPTLRQLIGKPVSEKRWVWNKTLHRVGLLVGMRYEMERKFPYLFEY